MGDCGKGEAVRTRKLRAYQMLGTEQICTCFISFSLLNNLIRLLLL